MKEFLAVTKFRTQQAACENRADPDGEDPGSAADRENDVDREACAERAAGSAAEATALATDVLHEVRADLYYIASDLRALAAQMPAQKAAELLALSELISSLASKVR